MQDFCKRHSVEVRHALDAGCGCGDSTRWLVNTFPAAHAIGVDISAHFLALAELRRRSVACFSAGMDMAHEAFSPIFLAGRQMVCAFTLILNTCIVQGQSELGVAWSQQLTMHCIPLQGPAVNPRSDSEKLVEWVATFGLLSVLCGPAGSKHRVPWAASL